MDRVLNRITAELIDNTLSSLLKILKVRLTPPILEITLSIILRSVIVEAVSHFMADNSTDRTVVKSFISREIEERRLKNAGREDDLIHRRIVIRVDGRRSHAPFSTVNWLAEL